MSKTSVSEMEAWVEETVEREEIDFGVPEIVTYFCPVDMEYFELPKDEDNVCPLCGQPGVLPIETAPDEGDDGEVSEMKTVRDRRSRREIDPPPSRSPEKMLESLPTIDIGDGSGMLADATALSKRQFEILLDSPVAKTHKFYVGGAGALDKVKNISLADKAITAAEASSGAVKVLTSGRKRPVGSRSWKNVRLVEIRNKWTRLEEADGTQYWAKDLDAASLVIAV